jgi:tetratricopeptide (TPR) repeat protein
MSRAKVMFCMWACVVSLCAGAAVGGAAPQETGRPLEAARLLALVAGSALPENIQALIEVRGLAFQPSEEFEKLLKQAGANAGVMKALKKAKVSAGGDATGETQVWAHLSLAGKLIREKKYGEGESELTAGLKAGADKLEAGFVMGEALRQQEEWEKAAAVYMEIVKEDKDFPEVQTKLSLVLYKAGDPEESLRAAKAALEATPNNAEAHKNAGLALEAMRKYDAAEKEYQEALRLKTDYQLVHFDLGLLFYYQNNFDESIAEYKKALALDPNDAGARLNLGLAYNEKNEPDNAIRELREAKKLDPKNFQIRQNLGSILIHVGRNADAVAELRELEVMAPESAVCHLCLAGALNSTGDAAGAKKELQIAMRLDPENALSHRLLGGIYEAEGKNELALKEYRESEELDPDLVDTRIYAARVLVTMKQAAQALEELKPAINLQPGNSQVHEQYGKVLEALGKLEEAKSEYRESLLLDKENTYALLDLAQLEEKQGDWPSAMENYHAAAKKVQAAIMNAGGPEVVVDAPGAYQAAQMRLKQHLSELRAAGKGQEAADLEARVESKQAGKGISGKLDAAMEAGSEDYKEQRFAEAERNYQEAVRLGEQLRPHEGRLVLALGYLGSLYTLRKDYPDAQAAYERSLKTAEEVYGPGTPQVGQVLQALTRLNLEQGDPARAEGYAQQNLTIAEKNGGTSSLSYSIGLMTLGYVYYTQKQYAKAEPYMARAVEIHEQLSGPQAMIVVSSKQMLCTIYDGLGQAAKAATCASELMPVMEKAYGTNSKALAPLLTLQAKALRALGRAGEAEEAERRMESLTQATVTPN